MCGQCQQNCKNYAIYPQRDKFLYFSKSCSLCEACVDHCLQNALTVAGRDYTVNQLLSEIEKDLPFYEQSGGGVTLSGGEVLSQLDFVVNLIKGCKRKGIKVAVDTCGHVPYSSFEKVLPDVDLFLYDLKLMDPLRHEEFTGKGNALILDNLTRLAAAKAPINIRIPLIEGINTDSDNIRRTIEFIKGMDIKVVSLLPYHELGSGKYKRLNRVSLGEGFRRPSEGRLKDIKELFEGSNFQVTIGG